MPKRSVLIAYFSHSGNTQTVARQIQEITGGDLFEISPAEPYPRNYDAVVELARKELRADSRPTLKSLVSNLGTYDTVYLGYPNWCATIPMALFTFLENQDLSGKSIRPFCTHEGSGLGRSVTDIRRLCPDSAVEDGLAIRGGSVSGAQRAVQEWIARMNR